MIGTKKIINKIQKNNFFAPILKLHLYRMIILKPKVKLAKSEIIKGCNKKSRISKEKIIDSNKAENKIAGTLESETQINHFV